MGALLNSLTASRTRTAAAILVIAAAAVAIGVRLFGLTVPGAIALYFVVWWTVLFAVLPFGIRSQVQAGEVVPGSEPGAPALPVMAAKAIWTSLAATVVFLAACALLPLTGL